MWLLLIIALGLCVGTFRALFNDGRPLRPPVLAPGRTRSSWLPATGSSRLPGTRSSQPTRLVTWQEPLAPSVPARDPADRAAPLAGRAVGARSCAGPHGAVSLRIASSKARPAACHGAEGPPSAARSSAVPAPAPRGSGRARWWRGCVERRPRRRRSQPASHRRRGKLRCASAGRGPGRSGATRGLTRRLAPERTTGGRTPRHGAWARDGASPSRRARLPVRHARRSSHGPGSPLTKTSPRGAAGAAKTASAGGTQSAEASWMRRSRRAAERNPCSSCWCFQPSPPLSPSMKRSVSVSSSSATGSGTQSRPLSWRCRRNECTVGVCGPAGRVTISDVNSIGRNC